MPASTSTRPAHLSSASDNWPTPQDFYDGLDAEFGFVLDVCASSANHKTTQFYALDHPDTGRRDGLAQDWAASAAALGGPVWMNPPYGRPIAAWMSKAFEAAQAGATVVTLVPVRADTAWWHDLVLATGAEVRYVRGRLTFGNAVNTAAFSSAVVVYRPTDQVGAPGPVRTTPAHPFTQSRPEPATAAEVAQHLEKYTPACLSAERWAQCADVARAAVAAARPPTVRAAQVWLLHLCQFLATPCGWTGEGAPDLSALLTEHAISAFVYDARRSGNGVATVHTRRTDLRHIARAANVAPQQAPSFLRKPGSGLRPGLLAAAKQPLPIAGIAQAWEHGHGAALPQNALMTLVLTLLARCENTATQPDSGTFWSPASLRVLAEAADQPVKEREASMQQTSPTRAPKAATKMSRRAVLQYAKANLAAAKAHRDGPTLADAPEPSTASKEVVAAIDSYRPRKKNRDHWDDIAELTRRLTLGYEPPNPRTARSTATHISTFLRWFRAWPGRYDSTVALDARELLTPGVVDTYLAFSPGPPSSRATQRAVLRRALNALDGSKRAVKLPYQPVAAPYTPAQCARFVALARHQPTIGRKRSMAFLVGLGLGAGLDGHDLKTVTRADLVDVWLEPATPILTVTVTGARGQRTVPVRTGYEALVREGLALHDRSGRGPGAALLGGGTTRQEVTGPVTSHAVTADANVHVDIEANRLRNTWLVAAMCAAVPVADLLRAAGLRTARTIGDLLPYCPDADPSVIAAVLAAMGDTATTGSNS